MIDRSSINLLNRSGSTDRPSIISIGVDRYSINLLNRSGSTDIPSISSIDRGRPIFHQYLIDRDRPIFHQYLIDRDRPIFHQYLIDRDRPIFHQSPQSIGVDRSPINISSIGVDRYSINLIDRGRGFSILAYFFQSCLTRCNGRSDESSVCRWISTDEHSKGSYSSTRGCLGVEHVQMEKSVCFERSNVSGVSHQPVCRVCSERSNVRNQYCGLQKGGRLAVTRPSSLKWERSNVCGEAPQQNGYVAHEAAWVSYMFKWGNQYALSGPM